MEDNNQTKIQTGKTQENLGRGKHLILFITILGIVIIAFDQIMKRVLVDKIRNLPFITKTCNTGAAFSILNNSTTFLTIISIIILVVLLVIFIMDKNRKIRFFLGLIMAGAIGNLIDRIADRCVIDFIDFKIWPIFNVADSAITIGVTLLIIYMIKEEIQNMKNKKKKYHSKELKTKVKDMKKD